MRLYEYLTSKKMLLSWTTNEAGERIIVPDWYLAVEINVPNPPQKQPAQIEAETRKWLVEMSDMWAGLPAQSRPLAGALGISLLVGDYSITDTCTDIAMLSQQAILKEHVSAARRYNFHLMRRISGRPVIGGPIKYHLFRPISVDEVMKTNGRLRLELTRIDPVANMICLDFIPRNHIKIHLFRTEGGFYVCREDKHPTNYPIRPQIGVSREIGGRAMHVVNGNYLLLKERKVIETHESRDLERHAHYVKLLEDYVETTT
jgi:hypothetical protein